MKAYGWDREKKNEHINAEGKHLKASKAGKIFKADAEFNKKFNQNQGSNHELDKNYGQRNYDKDHNHGLSLFKKNGAFRKRLGYSEPTSYESPHSYEEYKYVQPEVEYTETEYKPEMPPVLRVVEPKENYRENNKKYEVKKYRRVHYPMSGAYLPEMNYKNSYDTYKNSLKYPSKEALFNQGYHAAKYYEPKSDDHSVEDNLVEYYEKSNYQPLHISHEENPTYSTSDDEHYSSDKYSDDKYSDDEDEGRYYYDKKMTGGDINKLRESYSKYNDDYAGTQLLPQKVYMEATHIETDSIAPKNYRLYPGSHYY